ncbi:MAG: hypothetical protein C5B49_14835 [Bdellovibrio sp.]|nr:MAG: hypothetical protein C5B49_14835 [Bdellovibrio sp.]
MEPRFLVVGKVMTQPHILQQLIFETQFLLAQGKAVLVVFDIDSTLLDVSPRIERIIHDFADEIVTTDPETAEILKTVRTQKTDWGIRSALERVGLRHEHHEDTVQRIKDFWHARFFSNQYLHLDEPLPGSVEFVNHLYEMGADVAYLTGRDEIRMGPGTAAAMAQHRFPLSPPRARLVLKPRPGIDDFNYKEEWFYAIPKDRYERIWFFENEPVNIAQIRLAHPEVRNIFVDTTHSGKAEPPTDLPVIFDFLWKG